MTTSWRATTWSTNAGTPGTTWKNTGRSTPPTGGKQRAPALGADALAAAVVNNSGIIEARTVQNVGGVIKLMADMQTGQVNAGGTLDASAPDGGDGGVLGT